jgi:hypothetical protein
MKKVLVIVVALTFLLSASAFAGANLGCKIAIHLKAHPTSCTKGYPVFTACNQIITTRALLGDFDAMPVFYMLNQITVTEFGVTWPAEWGSMSWIRCKGDVAIGTIIYPGDGTAIAWQVCQYAGFQNPGFGWLAATGPGYVTPVPNPATHQIDVVDCAPSPGPYQDFPFCLNRGGVGGFIGDDPCLPTANEPSTWGQIKSMFR